MFLTLSVRSVVLPLMLLTMTAWLLGNSLGSRLLAQDSNQLRNPFELVPSEESVETDGSKAFNASDVEPEANDDKSTLAVKPAEIEAAAEQKNVAVAEAQPEVIRPAAAVPDAVLAKKYNKAYIIEVEGPIFGRFHWFLNQRLDRAKEIGADLVIVRLTSPGGDLEQSLQLARRLRDIDWATTIAYIPDEAISGGAIISLGCDRIYMKTGALIGDAGPIRMGMDGQFQHAEEKVVSFLVSAVSELAKAKGRPAAVAEAMVDRSVVLYHAIDRQTGAATILTEAQTEVEGAKEQYQIGPVVAESGNNRFLTVGAERAKDLLLSEAVFADEQAMLKQLDVKQIERTSMTWIDKTVFLLNRPWLTVLLLIVGLVGLYFELAAPGISVAGLVSLLCFGIFFWSHALGGTSGWLEVLLFALGVVCLICELFVLPGFGVFGLTGLGLLAVSLVMASQDFMVPNDRQQWLEMQYNAALVLGVMGGVVALAFLQVVLLDSIPGLNRFRLAAPEAAAVLNGERSISLVGSSGGASVSLNLGEQGAADSDLRPSGKVMLSGRLIDVVTEGDYVDAGSRVEVIRIEGNRVTVRRVEG